MAMLQILKKIEVVLTGKMIGNGESKHEICTQAGNLTHENGNKESEPQEYNRASNPNINCNART